ncbi:ISLre2 family transposase [Limosilactobacillus reuteri]|nr:ISLre2 family transposase [Limosilactobacillus reuteri]PTS12376.1 ISLre2 family transposase [Limosilactobacillus reuteri]QBE45998.1 ISLre2 family transposase [Limosilactobacillus reuteri]QPB66684.1 ISLre2 family transposase [Limosilactobacillus reuteri]UAW59714.1 ISLre2 family transposase [Limosilactobacillus reuteri]
MCRILSKGRSFLMDILTEIEQNLVKSGSLFEAEQIILKGVLELGQAIMQNFLESLDRSLKSQTPANYQVINKQPQTLNFIFGPVTFQRRYYQAGTKKREFYLDQQLKIKPRRRLSPHYLMMMAKIAQTTTMRNTADILNLVFDSGITADSVMHAVHELGNQIANQIINRHDFLSVGHQGRLEARLSDYLARHYKLAGQTVFLASDAGPGYEPAKLLSLVPQGAHGEYFLDRYHCLQKIEYTLGRHNELAMRAIKAVRHHDQAELTIILDTYESQNLTEKQADDLMRLRKYLQRNWRYILSPQMRGFKDIHLIGSVESSHRAFTYRMKKQGKSWTEQGAKAMIGLIEARMNGELQASLNTILEQLTVLPRVAQTRLLQEMHIRTGEFLRKAPTKPSIGAVQGIIPINTATSRPMG